MPGLSDGRVIGRRAPPSTLAAASTLASWLRSNRLPAAAIVGLASSCTALYLVMGAGYKIDDFPLIRNLELRGWTHLLDPAPWDRPVAGAYWLVVFGLGAHHPIVPALFGLVFSTVSALLIYDLVQRFVSRRTGLVTALLWLLFPAHTSLEMWLTTTAIGMSLCLALIALRVGCAAEAWRRRHLVALVVAFLALMTYETTAVLLVPGFALLTWLAYGKVDRRLLVGGTLVSGAVLVYVYVTVYLFGPNYRPAGRPNLLYVIPANFGWGIAPVQALEAVTMAIGVGCAVFVTFDCWRSRRSGTAVPREDMLVVAGLALLFLGTLPYVRYVYYPQGAGDRFNVVSSVGGAMVWAGALAYLARRASIAAVVAGSIVVVCAGVTRFDRTHLWSAAADDANLLIAIARRTPPQPHMVIGEKFVIRSVISGIGYDDRAESIVQLAYGTESVHARWAENEADWAATPVAARLDLSSVSVLLRADLVGHG